MSEFLQIAAYLFCLVASGFFSGIETGVISIHPVRLKHRVKEGQPGADTLQGFVEDSDRLLGTTLVGTNLCVVIVSVISASVAVSTFGAVGEGIAGVITALLVLVFAEYLPKAWFHSRPTRRSLMFVGPLRFSEIVLRPLAVACVGISKLFMPGKVSFGQPGLFATKEDLKHLADEGAAHGALSHRERFMINRVFELSGKTASQIMIPRDDMVHVENGANRDGFFKIARETGFTRFPVYDADIDDYVGIINVFHVLSGSDDSPTDTLSGFARPPFFVANDMPVDDILPLMRWNRQPVCLVRDPAGKVAGMVTTEDILEEIVGAL